MEVVGGWHFQPVPSSPTKKRVAVVGGIGPYRIESDRAKSSLRIISVHCVDLTALLQHRAVMIIKNSISILTRSLYY